MKIPYEDCESRFFVKAIGFGLLGLVGLCGAVGNAYTCGQFTILKTFNDKGYDPEEILGKEETEEDS